jgi:exodeoxyribonuclease VII large subunit
LYEDLHHAAGDRFAGLRADVTLLASRLQAASPRNRLQQAALRADELARRLEAALERARRERHHRLAQARSHLLAQSPEQRLRYARRELATLARRFERAGTAALRRQQDRQGQLARRLENLSLPRALQRGYAIVRNSRGEVVTRKEGLRPGERLSVDFADGEIHVTVEET